MQQTAAFDALPRMGEKAFAAAGLATGVICAGWGVAAWAWAAHGLTQQHPVIVGILLSPFVGAALAVISGVLAVLPASAWALCAALVGPYLLVGRRLPLKGAVVGAVCAAPAALIAWGLSHGQFLGSQLPLHDPMLYASLAGGPAAGLLLGLMLHAERRGEWRDRSVTANTS
jgi:hypothetical protein